MSRYFRWRLGGRHAWHEWPKLTVACDTASHFLLGAFVCMGPTQDSPQFAPVMREAAALQPIHQVLADKGYDAEHNHALCRESLGVSSTVIAVRRNTNGTRQWPQTPYRRAVKHPANRESYGQRWQVESAFSRNKRRFGPALRARTWAMQQWECLLRVLTHNVLLLAGV